MRNQFLAVLAFATAMSSVQVLAADRIRIMHYNVENLFDTQHDQGKDDWEYLPANTPGRKEACAKKPAQWMVDICLENDWTEQRFEMKLDQIKKVVQATGQQLPDMMSVVEIENDAVIKRLSTKLGYREYVVTESPDERGIDVALMFNQKPGMRLVKAENLKVPAAANPRPTRDILKVTFKTGARNLIVYVNHWPSQGAPAPVRRAVAEIMMKSAAEEMKAGNAVIATGDFNVISEDRPDPFFEVVNNQSRPQYLLDVHTALKNAAKDLGVDMNTYPAGTYFFAAGFAWNLLDRFFVSPDMLKDSGVTVDLKSYQIFNPAFLTESTTIRKGAQAGSVITGTPHRYDHKATNPANAGFSDHFPILLNLDVR